MFEYLNHGFEGFKDYTDFLGSAFLFLKCMKHKRHVI